MAQIRTTLRAFYFSLAHQDWEAMTADILAAKVVAHRPAPQAMVRSSTAADPVACPSRASASVDRAAIALDGDWAEASVGADRFRLIRFEDRWRFVSIHLCQGPVSVLTDRIGLPRTPP
ncbi:MAG: hypothetical protein ACREMX_08195 [Gemmatimonadales bacterium]